MRRIDSVTDAPCMQGMPPTRITAQMRAGITSQGVCAALPAPALPANVMHESGGVHAPPGRRECRYVQQSKLSISREDSCMFGLSPRVGPREALPSAGTRSDAHTRLVVEPEQTTLRTHTQRTPPDSSCSILAASAFAAAGQSDEQLRTSATAVLPGSAHALCRYAPPAFGRVAMVTTVSGAAWGRDAARCGE